MQPFSAKKHGTQGPEAKIQKALIKFLERKGWWCKATHGNAHTDGWPDIYITHPSYGTRWVEIKLPDMKGSQFTKAQLRDFPSFNNLGGGVWILTAATHIEYVKLFETANWWLYLSILK